MPEEGTIPYRRRIISSRRFCVGVNRLSIISDVAAWIRGISRYQRGHSRSARSRAYLDHCALPAWANGGVTRKTSQTWLELEKGKPEVELAFAFCFARDAKFNLGHPSSLPSVSRGCGSIDANS